MSTLLVRVSCPYCGESFEIRGEWSSTAVFDRDGHHRRAWYSPGMTLYESTVHVCGAGSRGVVTFPP